MIGAIRVAPAMLRGRLGATWRPARTVWQLPATMLAVALLVTAQPAAAEKTVVTLGTATPGGGFPVYGEALAAAINETDDALEVRPGTPGSTIDDLKGKPVAFGAKGSGLIILARYVLDGLGLDRDRDFQAIFLDRPADGPQMVLDGPVAALWGGGIGWPGFTAVARGPAGARFIVPGPDDIERIRAKHGFLRELTVPAGSYPGQAVALRSVGSWSLVMARPSLPDDIAYRLARALHRGEASLGRRLAQARETTAANTVAAAPRLSLIHPGAPRYFREIGLAR